MGGQDWFVGAREKRRHYHRGYKKSNWVPMHDFSIVPNIVYSSDGGVVRTVIIDGKIVMENRQIKTLDENSIIQKVQRLSEEILERCNLRIKSRWPVE